MHFEKASTQDTAPMVLGFLTSYLLFTTILYFVLTFFNRLPDWWTYWHMIPVTAAIAGFGYWLREALK